MNIDNIIDGLFSEEELIILTYLKKLDIEKLKKVGEVTQEVVEENGITKTTTHFVSFDCKYNFTKTNSYFTANEDYERIKRINQKISNAVDNEDYELALILKKEKEELLHKLK